jgi:hypothetical protein
MKYAVEIASGPKFHRDRFTRSKVMVAGGDTNTRRETAR